MAKNSINSLFELKKINGNDIHDSEQKIHTINLFSPESQNLYEINGLGDYFDSRIRFIGASYEFAKEVKLREDFSFDESTATQDKLSKWLENNQKAVPIKGTEFGVLATKVIESISSIEKNKYLKELQESLKQVIILSTKPETNLKNLKDEAKKLIVTVEDIQAISETEIQKIFRYELIQKAKNILKLVQKIKQEDILVDIIEDCERLLSEFKEKSQNCWENAFKKTQANLEERANLAEFFILKLYFAFDADMRSIENEYLSTINENLNTIKQNFAGYILEKTETKEQESGKITSKLQNIWDFDWVKENSVDDFFKLYRCILDNAELKPEDFPKEKSSLFLSHPKSAPSFPSLKDNKIGWDNQNTTSNILMENDKCFDSLKFLDFLLFRVKKIIENSDVYKVYRHLSVASDFEWANWLYKILESDSAFIKINVNLENLVELKPVKQKINKSNRLVKKATQILFISKIGTQIRIENRLPILVANELQKNNRQTIQGSTDVQEYLKTWIVNHFVDLSKIHVEIAQLRDLFRENLLDNDFIKNWIELICKEENSKLAFQTENRLKKLKESKIEPNLDVSKISKNLKNRLIKLENHLLLHQNHNNFRVFDRASLDKYKKLSQIVFETCLRDPKQISNAKSLLAELTLSKNPSLAIKIDRMTSTKPNGKSGLVFELNSENFEIKTDTQAQILVYPMNLGLFGGSEIKIVDTVGQAKKELAKGKFERVLAGFLNGNSDNSSEKTITQLKKKDGSDGQYTSYGKWKLQDLERECNIIDPYRQIGETVGATNPAGYPKLYFFLISKICNNLIIPVNTSDYYFKKYSPFSHLQNYLKLEKQAFELEKLENKTELKQKIAEILMLRCYLRAYYRLSSLELDLIQDFRLKPNRGNKTATIEPYLSAQVHLQFGNPRKKVESANLVENKNEITYFQKQNRAEHILSVDLGEKHLACATLAKINWNKLLNDDHRQSMEVLFKSYLPLQVGSKKDLENEEYVGLNQILDPEFFKNQTKVWESEADFDQFYPKYTAIINRYKSQQKQFGVVRSGLANAKKNLTDKLAEQIATQIAKIAYKYNAIVVFENLSAGFGRRVETVRLYTQIKRLTAKILGEIGLLDTSWVKAEADLDNFPLYSLKYSRYGLVNPSYTSQSCSNCGYVAVLPKTKIDSKIKDVYVTKGVEFNTSDWKESGIIEMAWQGQKYTLKDISSEGNPSIEIKDFEGGLVDLENVEPVFTKKNTNNIRQTFLDALFSRHYLFSKQTNERIKPDSNFAKFILNTVLKPRKDQKTYLCPFCHHSENADYQASYNIGLHFLVGLKIVLDKESKGVKSEDLKKRIVEEIRERLQGE